MGELVLRSERLVVVLTQADVCHKFPGWVGPLALLYEQSALPGRLCLNVAGLQKLPSILARLSHQVGLETTFSNGPIYDTAALSGLGHQASGPANQTDLYPVEFPGQTAPSLRLYIQMSKAADWDFYLCIAGKNSFYQDPEAGCCKSLSPSPLQPDSQ